MDMERYDRYIENLRRIRSLSRPQIPSGTDAQGVLKIIQNGATESFQRMKENNQLLNELVFSRTEESLTEQDVEELLAFAGRLFAYSNSEDNGIAYKIHQLLLEYAKKRQDEPFIIRELYNCGICLHYLNVRDEEYRVNVFGEQVRAYFEEAVTYMHCYEKFDSQTRSYLIRCLGNSKMALNRSDEKSLKIYMDVFDRAIAIMTDPYYQKLNPEIPWKNFIYTMNIDLLSLLPYLRKSNDRKAAEKIYHSAEYVYNQLKENECEEERLQNWRVHYFYWAARFHTGRSTAREAIEAMLRDVEQVDPTDFSPTGINYNLGLPSHMYRYVHFLPPEDRKDLDERIQAVHARSMKYLSHLPATRYPRVASIAIRDMAETQANRDDHSRKEMLRYLLAAHKPTYVHSLMVARMTRLFVEHLLEQKPEQLLGLMGYQTVEELKNHAEAICSMAYECGLYHDIGKNSVIMYISTNARRLLDEEFRCIQLHPVFGYWLLAQIGNEKDLAQAALFHHRFYDETGGYPKDYGSCRPEMKPIVDILNVTDSLDAATDNIGRCYTTAKSLETLIEEFRAQKGTRYAPYVVELFDDPAFCGMLDQQLYETRKQVYLEVYNTPDDQ